MTADNSLDYPDYDSIINLYTERIHSMYGKTGGQIRGAKGELVENIVDAITQLAWHEMGDKANRFNIQKQIRKIAINEDYVKNLSSEYIRDHIEQNKEQYTYKIELDKAVEIDNNLILGIECKSYMDNTMLRRTLKDFELVVKLLYPDMLFCVFQLINGLGGDYGEVCNQRQLGSRSTHTLMSYTPEIYLEIITLLSGKMDPKRSIHDPDHFKELPVENVETCVKRFKTLLKPFL